MVTPEPRRPLIARVRRALLGKRASTVSSALRNIDGIATSGHQHRDADLTADRDPARDDRK